MRGPRPCRPDPAPGLPTLHLPQVHWHDTLAPTWLALHVALREHVEHGQHLQPQQRHGCGW